MSAKVGIGLLGFGTVGVGIHDLLVANAASIAERRGVSLSLNRVGVRDLSKPRAASFGRLTDDLMAVVEDPETHVVAEVMGGVEPARALIRRALELGKPVATANKELMAKHGAQLLAHARENGVGLRYEASVGGGIPVLAALDRQLQANRIEKIEGIVNGTCNYILTRMEHEGKPFEEILKDAQAIGFAEADPSADVDGFDSAYKLTILASIATGKAVDWTTVNREGIRGVSLDDVAAAKAEGKRIKLVAKMDGSSLSVAPEVVDAEHPLYSVMGGENAIAITGSPLGTVTLRGPGAGAGPTASAVMGDVVELATGAGTLPYLWA